MIAEALLREAARLGALVRTRHVFDRAQIAHVIEKQIRPEPPAEREPALKAQRDVGVEAHVAELDDRVASGTAIAVAASDADRACGVICKE